MCKCYITFYRSNLLLFHSNIVIRAISQYNCSNYYGRAVNYQWACTIKLFTTVIYEFS
jgi:hypothetical protein